MSSSLYAVGRTIANRRILGTHRIDVCMVSLSSDTMFRWRLSDNLPPVQLGVDKVGFSKRKITSYDRML